VLFTKYNTIITIESRRMRYARNIARMCEEKKNGVQWESQKENDHQEDLDIGGRITL
jgi:hypothetical protein